VKTKRPTITGQMAADGRFPLRLSAFTDFALRIGGSLSFGGQSLPSFRALRGPQRPEPYAVEPRKLRWLRRGFTERFQAGAVRLVLKDATTVGRGACSFNLIYYTRKVDSPYVRSSTCRGGPLCRPFSFL
jgi:hypothetical protein